MALAGCSGDLSFPAGLGFGSGTPQQAIALVGGDVVATGPDGYCVAPRASNARNGFALLAGCGAIAGDAARPSINALITVQAGAENSASVNGSEQGLHDFLDTAAGRAALSQSGDADTVKVDGITHRAGRVSVVFEDTSPEQLRGFQAREWRSFMDVNTRLVTVTVRGLAGDPLSDARAQALLTQAVGAIRDANAATDAADTQGDAG